MIEYRDSPRRIGPEQLAGFFVDWPSPPTPKTHLRLLIGSSHVVIAADTDTGQVVGFITAVSDGLLSAYISLLEVLPSHQGQGIGTELLRRMLARLDDLYMIDLMCDADLESFYRHHGMRPAHGMVIRNYERQSG